MKNDRRKSDMPGMMEYMCSYCGRKERKTVNSGKPQPGTCTKKGKTRDGRTRPHTWVKNRTY